MVIGGEGGRAVFPHPAMRSKMEMKFSPNKISGDRAISGTLLIGRECWVL